MGSKDLTLAIIIPVYNEEDYIVGNLDSINEQTVKPDEVIVVDNNSNDNTLNIVKKYEFVNIIKEKKQGLVFARNSGFNISKSDLLARIDADTVLPPSWVSSVKSEFETNKNLAAVSAGGRPYDVFFKRFGYWIFETYHEKFASLMVGHPVLWGSNMVLRREAWKSIKNEVHNRVDIWEDYDLSFHLNENNFKISFGKIDVVKCSYRLVHIPIFGQISYLLDSKRVFSLHQPWFKTLIFITVILINAVIIFPISVLDRILTKK